MRRVVAFAATAAVLAVVVAGPALAGRNFVNCPDQTQTDVSWAGTVDLAGIPVAQTFTAGSTNKMAELDIYMSQGAVPARAHARPHAANSATIEIRTTSGGVPAATVVASMTATLVDGLNDLLLETPTDLILGTKYAIVVTAAGPLGWSGTCAAAAYARGEALILDGGSWKTVPAYAADHQGLDPQAVCARDFAFTTYTSGATTFTPKSSGLSAGTMPATATATAPAADGGEGPLVPQLLLIFVAGAAAVAAISRFSPKRG
jgi:hypothetical protein